MLINSALFVLTLAVLLTFSHIGTCLQCYECGNLEKNCKDPFNSTGIHEGECGPDLNTCWKTKIYGIYGRSCGPDSNCREESGCYSCKTDLCNSSSSIVPSFILTCWVTVIVVKNIL